MKPISPDTTPEAEQILIEGYRRMQPWQKFQRIAELNQIIKYLALDELRKRYPNATERELRLRYASRSISPDLMRKAFGWDPEKKGY